MAVVNMSEGHVVTMDAAADTITAKMRIKKIRWIGATTAGHGLELRAGAYGTSEIVFSSVANAANFVDQADFNPPLVCNNLKAQTLASGVVWLYLE